MNTRSFLIPVHAALTVRSAGNTISPSSTFCFPALIHVGFFVSLHPTLHHKLLSHGILIARFECHFLWQNSLTLLFKLSKQDIKSPHKDYLLDLRSIVMDFTVGEKTEAVDRLEKRSD